jgi:hypothetical protein
MEDAEGLTGLECEAASKILSEDSTDFADLYASAEGISAKRLLIHLEASRRLAAMGGTMPELEDIPRLRADEI